MDYAFDVYAYRKCMSNVMHHAGFKQVQCKHVQPWQQTTCSTDCDLPAHC